MDEQVIDDLYKRAQSNGYAKNRDEFVKLLHSDSDVFSDMYSYVKSKGYQKDENAFSALVGKTAIPESEQVKKKEQSTLLRIQNTETPSMESSLEDGSLGLPQKNKFDFVPKNTEQQTTPSDATYVAPVVSKIKAEEGRLQIAKEKSENARLLNAQKIQDVQKEKEEAARIKANTFGISKSPEFQQKLNIVNDKLINKEEEEVVSKLNQEFGKYGFTFEETGIGDAMIVRSFDGKHSLQIDLDPFTNATEVNEATKLRQFLNAHAQEDFKIDNEDFLSKAYRVQNLRTVGRINPDGTESTVKMTSFEQDGKFYAIPTLFPKNPNSYNTDASTWQELPFEQALKLAKERGEVFQFKTDQEAKDFANGSWKDVSTRDIEADKFYKERGLDYITEKNRWEKYKELDDIIDFVEGNNDSGEEALKKSNPELFIKGKLRSDANQYIEKLKQQRDALEPLVKDYGFMSDGKSEIARMDWDSRLAERQKEIAGKAIDINNRAKEMAYRLNEKSINSFGIPAEDLLKYKNTDPRTQSEFDRLQKEYYDVQQVQKEAATKFEIAKTYFDGKADKQVNGEFKENLTGFWNATSDAYKQGNIGQQLLSFSMPGGKDISSFKDIKEASEYIAKQYADMSNTEDRAMARWRTSRGFSESLGVFFDDPAEILSTFVASSLSQILPYGTKIVAASTATGTAAGAGAGLAGGPFAEITVPGGAIAGAGQGFKAGMALTSLAAEYTNSVMAAVEKKGYNPMDPESLATALQDKSVWEEGRAVGLARGIPIAIVDLLSANLAGRLFKPASALASTSSKIAHGVAERLVFDPLAEGAGELAAQGSELMLGRGRKKISWSEIAEESMGGLGNNTINWGVNTYKDIRNKNNIDIAQSLSQIKNISGESASDEKITSWVDNMLQLKKIDSDVAQRINENVGLRRTARELLSVGTEKKINSEVLGRTMELLAARDELSSTTNRKEIYRSKIQAINEELAAIGESKSLVPQEKSVDLSLIIGADRKGTSQYSIDGRRFTKEQFIEKVNALPDEQLKRIILGVKNDPETSQIIKDRYNAIQKQETDAGVLRTEQSEMGLQEMGEGNAKEGYQNEKSKILSSVDETLAALQALPEEDKTNLTFTQEDGKELPIIGNEKTLAEMYHEVIGIPEEERTPSQQSVIDATDVSLKIVLGTEKQEDKLKNQIETFGVPRQDVEATHSLLGQVFDGLKKSGLTAAKTVGEWVGIGKGEEKPYTLKINGEDTKVKNVAPEIINGFYSSLEKTINETKFDKLPAKQWIDKFGKGEEAKWTGLADWLNQQQGSVSKADIQEYLKKNRIQIVEVVKGQGELNVVPMENEPNILEVFAADDPNGDYRGNIGEILIEDDGRFTANIPQAPRKTFNTQKEAEEYIKSRTNYSEQTKFSQYQLEGDKENYKEVLIVFPSRYSEKERIDAEDRGVMLPADNEKTLFRSSHFYEPNILVHLRMNTRYSTKENKDYLDPKTHKPNFDEGFEIIDNGDNYQVKKIGSSSPYFNTYSKKTLSDNNMSVKDLKEYLMAYERLGKLHPDFADNKKTIPVKVLFLEEVQSDWGQEGKRKGFEITTLDPERYEIRKNTQEKDNRTDYVVIDKTKSGFSAEIAFGNTEKEANDLAIKLINQNSTSGTPRAPFITDTNAWVKLGLKAALKEAVAQGVDKIAWTTGEQQNERYDLSKQVDEIQYLKNDNGTYLVHAIKGGERIESKSNLNEKDLEGMLGKDVAKRIIENEGLDIEISGLDGYIPAKSLRGQQLSVGGKGMKGFYGSPTEGSLGIVGQVAKSLFKQEPKTVTLTNGSDYMYNLLMDGKYWDEYSTKQARDEAKKELIDSGIDANRLSENNRKLEGRRKELVETTQHSIDITPEMRKQVESEGQPLFKESEAQYRIESGKNIIEAIKDFDGSQKATVALTHEIMHPTVVSIIDGAKDGNEIGLKHTKTIIDEYNKATGENITQEQLIEGNDKFKEGTTTKEYRAVQEFIAKAWEKYHTEGGKGFSEAFQEVLDQITQAFKSVYKSLTGNELTPELKQMFDDILGKEQLEETASNIESIMTADPKDPAVLEKIFNVLDKWDNSLSKELGGGKLNDATRAIPLATMQIIVKSLKALVKTGMTLQEAIRKVSADNNVTEDDVVSSLTIINSIDENINEIPGYDRMIREAEAIIAEKKRGRKESEMYDAVMSYVIGSRVYLDATDVQREQIVRNIRERFGLKEKKAPSVGKLLGSIKDIKKITMSERVALRNQIKDLARGGRDAKSAINKASSELTIAVKKMASSGTITAKQAANVLRRLDRTNLLSQESIDRFTDYMAKVFEDAEYADKVNTAKAIRSQIGKLSGNEEKNAHLTALGKEFTKIDPSMTEDIDAYNNMASAIKESLQGSKAVKEGVRFAEMVNIGKASEYIKKAIEAQNKKLLEYKIQEVQDAMGIDASELSYEQLKEMLETDKPLTDYEDKIIRSTAIKMFDINSALIKSILETGKDPFTGDSFLVNETKSNLVKRFMSMNLRELSPKEAIEAVDALSNFIQNKSTAKMETVVEKYTGAKNVKELVENGVKSRELKKAYSKNFGRILADLFNPLNIVIEKMFPGVTKSMNILNKMGLTDVINGASKAIKHSDDIIDNYVDKFYDKKANKSDFTMDYNHIERGMIAEMLRSVIGSESEIKKDFNRKKSWVYQTINKLREGNDIQKAKAELYQKAYDKILKDANNSEDVIAKADRENVNAVRYWIDEFGRRYDEFSDVSENVYNTLLKRENNYTPRKFSFIEGNDKNVDVDIEQSSFHGNNNSVVLDKSANLKEVKEDFEKLPENMYLDLSFDRNMANSISNLLIDINTAAPTRRVNAFINSPYFKKLVPYTEDYRLLKGDKDNAGRIKLAIQNIRGKRFVSNDEMSKAMRFLNKSSTIGVGQALGGLMQPANQVIPVAVSTFINTGGKLDLSATFNKDKLDFMNRSGYGISVRGRKSQANVEHVDRIIEKASSTWGKKAVELLPKVIENTSEFYLKNLLERFDLYIAKNSWMTFYEESLAKQGIDPNKIDYKSHKLNNKAADYAESQVSRQQNINMQQLAGRIYSNKDASSQILSKIFLAFSNFRMNAAARLTADMITIKDKTATKEDRAIAWKSLAGYGAELATFRTLKIATSILLGSLALKYLGITEDDEDYEKRVSNTIKQARTSAAVDVISPVPVLDVFVQEGLAKATNKIEEITKIPISTYDANKQDFTKFLGTYGIPLERSSQIYNIGNLAATGEFKDDFGKTKYISKEHQEALVKLTPISVAANLGLLPTEFSTSINYAVKYAKKDASTQEGGKTREDLELESDMKAESEQRKLEKEEADYEKIKALRELSKRNLTKDKKDEIKRQIELLSMSEEEKDAYEKENKGLKRIDRLEKEELLQDYDNESEMKRYDPILWEKTFGPNSRYYKEHNAEKEVEKLLNKEMRAEEDVKRGYTKPEKKKKKKW